MKKLRYGCLFSGIGAPLQGAFRVYGKENVEHVFSCECDKFARQSFKANYDIKDEHYYTDINDMDAIPYQGKVDVIIGGSPCQSFSIAGLRDGLSDKRGQLIWQYFRIIKEVMPPIFIYENVKGFVSDKGGRTLKDFLEVFRTLGYNCHHEVVNTKDYGVPQNRERIYIVGFLDDELYHRFNFAPKIKLVKRLRDVLDSEVNEKYYLSEKAIDGFKQHTEKMKAKGNGFKFEPKQTTSIASSVTTKAGNRNDDNFVIIDPCPFNNYAQYKDFAPTLLRRDNKDPKWVMQGVVGMLDIKGNESIRRVYGVDGNAPCLQTMQGGMREPKILDFTNDFNEGKTREYTEFSPTIISERFGLATEQNYRIRKLTPRECLRLQDFPDSFVQVVSDSQMYKQAGNSMSVNILEMIFRQIEKAKKGETVGLF
ncbi:MAG: DNA (cytosine-5-)-methyltransferase [Bacteroidia bacterium]|nr:DNA (cytosine-5-)-methyltransferase [Bacteroidia bacterium]